MSRDDQGSAIEQEARKLLEGITSGEWCVEYVVDGAFEIRHQEAGDYCLLASRGPAPKRHFEFAANANLIAAAPRLVRALLGELDQLRSQVTQQAETIADLQKRLDTAHLNFGRILENYLSRADAFEAQVTHLQTENQELKKEIGKNV